MATEAKPYHVEEFSMEGNIKINVTRDSDNKFIIKIINRDNNEQVVIKNMDVFNIGLHNSINNRKEIRESLKKIVKDPSDFLGNLKKVLKLKYSDNPKFKFKPTKKSHFKKSILSIPFSSKNSLNVNVGTLSVTSSQLTTIFFLSVIAP